MPSLHLVPMFFSSWMTRRRRACLADAIDDDGTTPDEDRDDLLLLLGNRKRLAATSSSRVHRDRLSVTEEDDDYDYDDDADSFEDDADDEGEDDNDCSLERYAQYSPTTTTTATTTTTTTGSTPSAAAPKPRRWHRVACKGRRHGYYCHQPELDDNVAIPDDPHDETVGGGSGESISCESTSLFRPVGNMHIIPFVSLHLHDNQRSHDYGSEHVDDSSTAGVDELFRQSTLEKASCDDIRESISVSPREAALHGQTPCSSPRLEDSPSLRKAPVLHSITTSASPLEMPLDNFQRIPLPPPRAPCHSLGGNVPTEITVDVSELDGTSSIIWDPARPLLCDGEDWNLHALQADVDSDFARGCRAVQLILQQDARSLSPEDQEAFLDLISQQPDLCLVRYRDDQSHQYPFHWCCRNGWTKGMQLCYSAAPEVIGFAVSSLLPLHLAVAHPPTTDASPELVEFLCQRYPVALKHTNSLHQTPLHLAVLSRSDFRVIECLLRWYPTAAQLADAHGWTPTHYACQHSGRGEVLRLLLQDSSCVAGTITSRLEKPLHIAARHNATDLIGILLEAAYHPRGSVPSAPALDREPSIALDAAAAATSPRDGRHGLRRTLASPASCTDAAFCTPLHYLATHGDRGDAGMLRRLVEACPSAKYATNENGCTPYELAVQAHAAPDLLSILQ